MSDSQYSRYLALIAKATEASAAYYDTDSIIMSDEEYDALIEEITILSDENGWSDADSLLNSVASGVSIGGDVVHTVPMLSLDKANTADELAKFIANVQIVDKSADTLVAEPKLDGLAVSVKYRNGVLVQAAVRGSGTAGEDITSRLTDTFGMPKTVAHKNDFEVRGEVYMSDEDYNEANISRVGYEYNRWAAKNGRPQATRADIEKLVQIGLADRLSDTPSQIAGTASHFVPKQHVFANSRNAVAGALRRETKEYPVAMRYAVYDLIEENNDATHVESMRKVAEWGFVPAITLIPASLQNMSVQNLINVVNAFGEARKNVDYPTDGIVLKANRYATRDHMGNRSKAPRWALAYKYPSVGVETVVKGIEVTIGRTGRLALRAKVVPVMVDGTVINYASLHNVSWLQEKDIRIGDTVPVRRANDVIPYVDVPDLSKRPAGSVPWVPPTHCPQCGSEWDKSTLLWRCPSPSCGVLNGLIHAAGRDYFDWEGLSEAILTRLNDEGLVQDIADVFSLTVADLAGLEMGVKKDGSASVLGEKTASKIYEQIQKSKTRPLSAVLAALGVRMLGRTFGRRLEAKFSGMGEILQASEEGLTQVEGIALPKAKVIHAGLREKLGVIKKLSDAGVTMNSAKPASTNSPFTGKKVCISGSIPGYSRGQAQELLTKLGASASSSVSSSTHYLIADEDSAGNSKYKKAQELGVTIITPAKFLELIG